MNMMNPAAGDNQDSYQTLFFVSNRVDGTHNAGRRTDFWDQKSSDIFWRVLGSENRDRGDIQRNSEPTSPPEPLLKINTIYVGFSGLSNVQKISSGRGGEHCENRNVSTRHDTTSPK